MALGRDLLGGAGRSTAGAYPPLVPAMVGTLAELVGPLDALRLVALGSYLAVVVVFAAIANDAFGWGLGLAAAATLAGATALAEPLAFGGYPQQVGLAATLAGAWAMARYLTLGRRRDLAGTTIALATAALAHHAYVAVALAGAGIVWLLWLTTLPPPPVCRPRTLGAALTAIVAAAALLPTALAFRAAGYAPPLDTAGFGPAEAFRYATRESPLLWLAIVGGGAVGFAAVRGRCRDAAWLAGAALALVGGAAFADTGEPRLVPPLLAGSVLGVGFGLRCLWQAATERHAWSPTRRHLLRGSVGALAVALPLLVWRDGDRLAGEFFGYYRVADRSLVAAAAALGNDGDGFTVVRHDRRGWPVGWWFEGLTETPIIVGADPRWLGFPAEREHAALAGRFFDRPLSGSELTALAAENNVDRLVFRKREWIGWQRWLEPPSPGLRVAFDDGNLVVVAIAPRSSARLGNRQSAQAKRVAMPPRPITIKA